MRTTLFIFLLTTIISCTPPEPFEYENLLDKEEVFFNHLAGIYAGTCISVRDEYNPMTGNFTVKRDTYEISSFSIDSINVNRVYRSGHCGNDRFDYLSKSSLTRPDTIKYSAGGGRYFAYLTVYPNERKITTQNEEYTLGPSNYSYYGTFYKID